MTDTPAPAKTMSETMTATLTEQDVRCLEADYLAARSTAHDGLTEGRRTLGNQASLRILRILATRAALQAKTEECAHLLDLQRVADADAERVDKVCQIIAGHRDDYRRERDQARAERDEARAALKEAQKDSQHMARLILQEQHAFNGDDITVARRNAFAADAARTGGANG